jgi:hypothetical protein
MNYGLNDPQSANYIANLNERIRIAAELQIQAEVLGVSVNELLESINA